MIPYYGDFPEDHVAIRIPFNTFDSNDPSASVTVTNLIAADIKVHKDGSLTQIVTDGASIVIDFDGITGNHVVLIDSSIHADYSTGAEYMVRLEGITVDAGTLNAWIGSFSIERAGGVLALLKGTNSLANIEDKIDIVDTNVDQIETAVITNAAGTDVAADIIALKAETVLILADTADIQPNYATEAKQDIMDTNIDQIETAVITNAAGADIAADVIALKAETALILADTADIQPNYATSAALAIVDTEVGVIDGIVDNILLDTAEIGTAGAGLSDIGINAASVDLIWDEPLTGGTHNVVNSSGRRLRQAQEAGGYTNGAVYLDTVGGTPGTTNFENGVDSQQVDSIADANTIATSVGLSKFAVAPNSNFTFSVSQDGQVFLGSLWTLALGGQSLNETHIIGAEVSGICTGHVHMDHCHLGICSFAQGEFDMCGLDGTFTITAANDFVLVNCYHEESTTPSTIDFGSAVAGSTVHIHGWKGALLVLNMGTGDTLHFSSAEGILELDSSNDGGTLNLSGTPKYTNGSSGMTLNDNREQALILADTNELQSDDVPTLIAALNDISTADVNTQADLALSDYAGPTKAEMDTAHDLLATEAKQDIIDTNVDQIETAVITNATGTDVAADIIALKAETVLIVADTNELQTDWANGGRLDLIIDLIEAVTTALGTGAAASLALSAAGIISGVAETGTLTTVAATTDLSGYADDQLIGRALIVTSGPADGEVTDVTDYANTNGELTFTALTTAMANGNTFVLV